MTPLRLAVFALLGVASTAQLQSLGDIKAISCAGAECNITALVGLNSTDVVPLRLVFYTPSIVRWWLALDGNFSDNVGGVPGRLHSMEQLQQSHPMSSSRARRTTLS